MNNPLRALTLSLIALALFVVPGEVRAFSYTPAQNITISPAGSGAISIPVTIQNLVIMGSYAQYAVFDVANLFINLITFQVSGQTGYAKSPCTENNAGVNPLSTYYYFGNTFGANPNTAPTYDAGGKRGYPGTYTNAWGWLFCVGFPAWSSSYISGGEGSYWILRSGTPYDWYTVTVPRPAVTVTSSNPAVVSCVGSICNANAGGTANLTVNFAPTTARAWLGSMLGVALQAGGPTVVPSTSTVVSVNITPAVNQIPTASITSPAGPITRTTSDTLILSGVGTDTDGTIASYEWTYGGCGAAGSHISWNNPYDATSFFNLPGTFTVYLTVTDNFGAKSTNCPSRVITVVSPPVISFFFPDATPINTGDSAILYWNAYGSGVVTCSSSASPVNALWSGAQPTGSGGFVTSPLVTDTTFTLTCSNIYGSDTKTATVAVTTPLTPPTAIIVPSTDPITIPLGSYGPSLNGYYTTDTDSTVRWTNTAGDNSWNLGSCNGPLLSGQWFLQNINYNIPGALEGASYKIYYSVQYNGVWSTNCPFRTIVMGPPTPTQLDTPINVSAAPACSSAVVSWSAVPNAMSYDVYRCAGIYCEEAATFAYSKKGNSTTPSFTNTGLTNGTTYFYRIQAKPGSNPFSDSNWSDIPPASVVPSCAASVCGNAVCESGENPLTCAKDCKLKYRQF